MELDMLACICNPSTERLKEDCHEFNTSLAYIVSSRRKLYTETYSRKEKEKKKDCMGQSSFKHCSFCFKKVRSIINITRIQYTVKKMTLKNNIFNSQGTKVEFNQEKANS